LYTALRNARYVPFWDELIELQPKRVRLDVLALDAS
jgi:hypothetical protein